MIVLIGELVFDSKGKRIVLQSDVRESVKGLKPLLNENCWQILRLLAVKSLYPAQIAKELDLHEQRVYYFVKLLRKAGLIEVEKSVELNGALAKYFKPSFEAISFVLGSGNARTARVVSLQQKKMSSDVAEFFSPFILNGKLNAKIVVGNPDPHGEFKARARDNYLAADLTAFLSSLCSEVNLPLVFLDTSISSIEQENSNLILIGGIVTNKLSLQINHLLPIKFVSHGGHWIISSTLSGKDFAEDFVGIVQKIPHPKFKDKSILVIAGNRAQGTKAAILSLAKSLHSIIKPNAFNKNFFAHVVEGLDLDADGEIDEVELKE